MDDFSQLRKLRSDTPGPTLTTLQHGRAALLERAAQASSDAPASSARYRARHRSRRTWLRVGLAGAAGAALIAGLVIGDGLLGAGASPAAAAVLEQAAVATIEYSDPVVDPGQYLRVSTVAVYSQGVNLPGAAFDGAGTAGDADDRDGFAFFLRVSADTVYIPADTDAEWVWERHPAEVYETFDAESERAAIAYTADDLAPLSQGRRLFGPDYVEVVRAPDGRFYGEPRDQLDQAPVELPRDPEQLLEHIFSVTAGQGSSSEGAALAWIIDAFRTGQVQADLRAALFQAATRISGVEVTDEAATLDGRTGVALGRVETADGVRHDLILDPHSGQFIGERTVVIDAGAYQGEIPVGTAVAWTAVSTAVVDEAPPGGSVYGVFTDLAAATGG